MTTVTFTDQAADDCGDAGFVQAGTVYNGDTTTATNDGSASCGLSGSSRDVWFKYRPVADGVLTVILCGSGYDTVASVHTDCPGTTTGQLWLQPDDFCGLQSTVAVPVQAANTYTIRIAGFFGNAGCIPDAARRSAVGHHQRRLQRERWPDECGPTATATACPTSASADCNENGVPDECDITSGTSEDCNANGIPDECELTSETDCNGNRILDVCDLTSETDCNEQRHPRRVRADQRDRLQRQRRPRRRAS